MQINRINKSISIVKDKPDIAEIAITNRCNLNCGMCGRRFYGLANKDMSFPSYKSIIKRIAGIIRLIIFGGWGEPTLNPHLWKMIAYANRKGLTTYLFTNGTLLDDKNIAKISESQLDFISISIENIQKEKLSKNGHPFNPDVITNINKIILNRKNNKKPHISLNITLHSPKSNILKLVEFAKQYGVDAVYLSRLNTAFNYSIKRFPIKKEMALWRDSVVSKNDKPLQVLTTNFQFLGLKNIISSNKICPKIYNFIYIDTEGRVSPCCSLPNYKVGDLSKNSLSTIWTSNNFKKFRIKQKNLCKNVCNL